MLTGSHDTATSLLVSQSARAGNKQVFSRHALTVLVGRRRKHLSATSWHGILLPHRMGFHSRKYACIISWNLPRLLSFTPLVHPPFTLNLAALQAYTTPQYFQDDWLNEYYDIKQQQQHTPAAAAVAAAMAVTAESSNAHQTSCCVSGKHCSCSSSGSGNNPTDAALVLPPAAAAAAAAAANAGNGGGHERERSGSASAVVTRDYRFVYLGPDGSWTPVHSGGCEGGIPGGVNRSSNVTPVAMRLKKLMPDVHW